MTNFTKKYPAIFLSANCALVGGVAMFVCMAAGEFFINPQMFHGFLNKPEIWPYIFIETSLWLIPFMLLIVPLLNRLKNKNPKSAKRLIALSWIAIGLIIATGYKIAYYSSDWSVWEFTRPNIIFGWTLPYIIILISFIYMSNNYVISLRKGVS